MRLLVLLFSLPVICFANGFDHYKPMVDSPLFAVASHDADLYLAWANRIDGTDSVLVCSISNTYLSETLHAGTRNSHGYLLVRVNWADDAWQTTALIDFNGRERLVGFRKEPLPSPTPE